VTNFKATFSSILLLSSSLALATEPSAAHIDQRTRPIGDVTIGAPIATTTTSSTTADSGKKVYDQYCSVCHSAGIAGAPKVAETSAWKPRLKKGLQQVVERAVKGFNAMPAKGNCATCSDSEIEAAVKYMLPNS